MAENKDKKVEPKKLNQRIEDDKAELTEKELDEVVGGKLPGMRKLSDLNLKRG